MPASSSSRPGARYYLIVLALHLFNLNSLTRRAYRAIGNRKNARASNVIQNKYFLMTPRIYDTVLGAGALRDGDRILEIGTGWTHWDALIARNHREVRATLCDVWDNRSFERFRSYLRQLADPDTRRRLGLDPDRNRDLMERAAAAASFDEAYAILGFDYRVDPSGRLEALEGPYDFIVSRDVGEHIRAEDIDPLCRRSFALLRPGGWAFHQIVLTDHVEIYLPDMHPKTYLSFDRSFHRRWIASTIQYTNLLQVPDWRAAFEAAGFRTAAVDRVGTCRVEDYPVHPSWAEVPPEDRACTVVHFLLQKPETATAA